jgi:DNA-binding transcriptional LysR family regulator
MIDGDCLAAFLAIAQERSFSRAADRLGIAQSVASKRLRRLEDLLETQLVDRRIRTDVRLTRVGQLYLPEAIETLARLEKAERSGRSLGRGSGGPLRIGFVFSAAMNGTLPTLLAGLCEAFPDLQLQPRLMDTPEQLASLDAGMLDLALVRTRPSYPPGCLARKVHAEGLVVCLSSGHRLAGSTFLAPEDLSAECFIVPQFHEEVGLIDSIRRVAKAGGFAMPPIIRTGDFVTAACLASTGQGIVLAPASLANLKLDGVLFREVVGFGEQLATMIVHRADAPGEAMQKVASLFRKTDARM